MQIDLEALRREGLAKRAQSLDNTGKAQRETIKTVAALAKPIHISVLTSQNAYQQTRYLLKPYETP